MGYGKMADKYFDQNPMVYEAIQDFARNRAVNIFKTLRNDENEINFLSWLSEMKFGLQFDKFASAMEYDADMNGQTPDWLVTANKQTFVAEVVRINLHELEMTSKIEGFISPTQADSRLVATGASKSLDGTYFYGALGKIEKKEIVYRPLITNGLIPFIICVYCSELTLFIFENDFFDFFLGDGKHGYFFRNKEFGENVTGIFFRDPYNQYKFIKNPIAKNKLNEGNLEFFN